MVIRKNLIPWFLINGSGGVRLFFVISGFLITLLLIREFESKNNISLKKFYARRLLRILPAAIIYISVIFVLSFLGYIHVSNTQLFTAYSYLWNYSVFWNENFTKEGSWFLGHLWSLSLEQQYYLVWPLLLVFFGIKQSKMIGIILLAIIPVIRLVSYFLYPNIRGQLGMMFHTAIDPMIYGSIGAIIYSNNDSHINKLLFDNDKLMIILCFFVFIFSPWLANHYAGAYMLPIGMSLECFCFTLIIIILQKSDFKKLKLFLENNCVVFVGVISYSLYLWQQLFLTEFNVSIFGVWPINILISFLCAIISYYYVERPFLRIKAKFN